MRILVIFAHPSRDSLNAALLETICRALAEHELRVHDLCAEAFDPVLDAGRYARYNDPQQNRDGIGTYADDLHWAEGLIFVYPTWWYGLPAILKGWLERVLVPGVALKVDADGKPAGPALLNIRLFGAVATYGAPWWWTRFVGDPGRRTLMRGVRWLCLPRVRVRTFWFPLYNIHKRERGPVGQQMAGIGHRLQRLVARTEEKSS